LTVQQVAKGNPVTVNEARNEDGGRVRRLAWPDYVWTYLEEWSPKILSKLVILDFIIHDEVHIQNEHRDASKLATKLIIFHIHQIHPSISWRLISALA
jgi:hypothetical protein